MSKQREAFLAWFEAWRLSEWSRTPTAHGHEMPKDWHKGSRWSMELAWQVSRAAALEEAAEICNDLGDDDDGWGCAAAIRALKEQS